jgi:hypothetical protein
MHGMTHPRFRLMRWSTYWITGGPEKTLALTCPLLKDLENTTKTVWAGQQAWVLQPADSDEEVFVLPDSKELDF